eukprot:3728804-Pleurochrysis_carterae.AAC.1
MSVEFGRRLPFTASDASVIQCMPAPVSPSRIVLALAAAIDCRRRQHDGLVCRLRLGFSAQVREVIVERCVAVGDEGYKNKQEAAQCQSAW